MRGGDEPQFLSVDLTGAKQLRLTAGETGEGIYNAHADWGGALLILKPGERKTAHRRFAEVSGIVGGRVPRQRSLPVRA